MLSVARHASVAEIPEWDALRSPPNMYLASWWLRDSEQIFAEATRTYLAVRDGERVIAATVCWTIPRPQLVLPPLESSRLFARWSAEGEKLTKTNVAPFPETELYPYTICGQPRGYVNALRVRGDLAPEARRDALARLFGAAEQVARDAGSKLLLVPYLELDDVALARAAAPRLEPAYGMTDCYLAPVPSMDEYLASFRSHRRQRIVQDLRRFDQEGLRIEVRRLSTVVERATELFVGGTAKYGWTADQVYAGQEVTTAAEHFDDKTRIFCALRGDNVVGMAYVVREQGVYFARRVGVVPEEGKRGALYLNLVYYAPIREAAGDGVHEIHYGGGSIEVKYRRGCKLRPRWNLVLPLGDWDEATRATMRACGDSMLEVDRGLLAGAAPADEIEEALGVPRARALGITR